MVLDQIHRKYEAALVEIEKLKRENERLELLVKKLSKFEQVNVKDDSVETKVAESQHQGWSPQQGHGTVHHFSKVEEKLNLFRTYFRGRDDVYPVRWNGKHGKSGYSPACGNEWTAVCHKPKVKCSVCTHQNFLPVTDEVISKHLDAREDRTIGVYPILSDETCWFLAMDFDKNNWQEDVAAVMEVCKDHSIPAALERSRSGNGGHIWIFFKEPIAAHLARKLGTTILSLTMKIRYQIGLDSYDRLFPNQDTLPKGGFGNLIALPLQGGPRKKGNSVFVDNTFVPYEDQWRFLSGLGRMSEEETLQFIRSNQVGGPYRTGLFETGGDRKDQPCESDIQSAFEPLEVSLPKGLSIILSDRLYIAKKDLLSSAIHRLMQIASFSNPDFYKTQAMRLSTYGKPRVISCAEDLPHHIALPRGCLKAVTDFVEQNGGSIRLNDQRYAGELFEVPFKGQLTMLQDAAAKAILAHDMGILSAATGFGKTVVAANIIAKRQVSTLILVHRRELMDQWKTQLHTFLNTSTECVGTIDGGRNKRTGYIDIAVIQSLNHKGHVKEYIGEYGQIIVDECHHVSAFRFEQVLMKVKAKYVVGLTATLKRQDGQEAIVTMQLGPVRMNIDAKTLGNTRGFAFTVVPRYTTFQIPENTVNASIQTIFQHLVTDEVRNMLIFDDLLTCLEERRSPLLLVERTAHAEYFEKRLRNFAKNVIVLRGGMGKRQREAIREQIASIPDDEERVFIATGKLIGEGFDDARLDTLLLVHPISWSGNLQQYAGRLHRTHVNKKEVKIYDYIDIQVPVLMKMYKKRVQGYKQMGYRGADI